MALHGASATTSLVVLDVVGYCTCHWRTTYPCLHAPPNPKSHLDKLSARTTKNGALASMFSGHCQVVIAWVKKSPFNLPFEPVSEWFDESRGVSDNQCQVVRPQQTQWPGNLWTLAVRSSSAPLLPVWHTDCIVFCHSSSQYLFTLWPHIGTASLHQSRDQRLSIVQLGCLQLVYTQCVCPVCLYDYTYMYLYSHLPVSNKRWN